MKKLNTLSILFISLIFIVPIQVSADTNAGVKPGSLFYFFDTASENIGLFFTFRSEKKAQKALEYADERLAEAEESANENNLNAVEKAMAGYKEEISFATEKSKELKDDKKAEELLNSVSENTAKHQEVLTSVLEKVPEEAKQAILSAIEVSKKGQEEAVKQISELKSEIERLKKEVEQLKKESNKQETSEVEKLKKEVEVLKKQSVTQPSQEQPTKTTQNLPEQKKAEEKSKTITLPSGAVVEMDASGNIIRTIKEAPSQTYTAPAPTPTTKTATSIQISSVNVTPIITSAKIEWQTDKPAESKIFLSGGGLSSKVYISESGLSTRHSVSVDGLKGATTYSYEIEAIVSGNSYKKTGEFITQNPPSPIFSIETFTHPLYPNHFFMRVNSANGNFEFKALTLEVDNPYGSTPGNSYPTNIGSIQYQTNLRTSGYSTCSGARNAFESWNKGAYPHPCPGSDDPEADNPGYLTSMNPRANGDSASIPIHPDIPYPNGTRVYYYKVIDKITGKVFEYQK